MISNSIYVPALGKLKLEYGRDKAHSLHIVNAGTHERIATLALSGSMLRDGRVLVAGANDVLDYQRRIMALERRLDLLERGIAGEIPLLAVVRR